MVDKIPKHFIDFIESKGTSTVEILETSFDFKRKGIEKWQDLVWHFLQKLHLDSVQNVTSEEEFYKSQKEFYCEMLYLRRRYEKQKANDLQSLINETDIQIKNLSNLKMDIRVIGDKRCVYSMDLATNVFEMEEGLNGNIINVENCTCPVGCTCGFGFHVKRDETGRIISK